ncbi:heavy metal-associated isoprenylated plant protein 47-like [Cornus florida]|uniref:heavy metal-associated isoprenylated plant protein 47-like n=1 Tax=Cornus florida TaxID=4283 RepID=UPI00289FB6B5|nr:heavy metal-associated isoprenylated plant protein 47-like [Cornus florida]
MKRKLVMEVQMKCPKCRTKALKIAAQADGVDFVGLEGDEKNKVVVIGVGVDATVLAKKLRKKVGHTNIISLADVKPNN